MDARLGHVTCLESDLKCVCIKYIVLNTLVHCVSAICAKKKLQVATCSRRMESEVTSTQTAVQCKPS